MGKGKELKKYNGEKDGHYVLIVTKEAHALCPVQLSPESPVQFLLRAACRSDINSQEKLPEVDEAVLIAVKGAEDMFTKLSGIPRREALAVDLHEGPRVELAIRTVHHEALVPLLDGVLVIPGVAF